MWISSRPLAKKLFLSGDTQLPNAPFQMARRAKPSFVVRALQVRPYTTRKGDTIETIAEKRGFSVDELIKLNHSMDVQELEDGMTLLLPAEKLSERDREIIGGIGRRYRTYPVRKGETVDEILAKRNISKEEFNALNPDLKMESVKTNTILKLPAGKYTTREKEMLIGSLHVPSEFFQSKGLVASTSVVGIAILISLYIWWRSSRNNKN